MRTIELESRNGYIVYEGGCNVKNKLKKESKIWTDFDNKVAITLIYKLLAISSVVCDYVIIFFLGGKSVNGLAEQNGQRGDNGLIVSNHRRPWTLAAYWLLESF